MRKMKDSDIEYIGEIPDDWEVLKVKNVCRVKSINGHPDEVVLSLYRDWGIVIKSERDDNFNRTSENTNNYKFVEKTDLVVNKMKAWQGSIAVSKYQGIVSPAYYVLKFHNYSVYPWYLNYLLRCSAYFPEYRRLSGGIRPNQWDLSLDNFLHIPVLLPLLNEQQRIASYLDSKCASIDSIIEKQRTVIEKLKAYKQSAITEAVTKGLNPDAPMKDSGIEWIGEIPKGWKIGKMLYALSMPITDGPHTTPILYDEGIPFLSAESVKKGKLDFNLKRGNISVNFYDECCKKYIPQVNDIYMIKSGATTGNIAIVETNSIFQIWSPLAVFRANSQMNHKYLYYLLQSESIQKQIQLNWSYGTQQNIGMRVLEKLFCIFLPPPEQQQIADYLDTKCAEIDKLITAKGCIIEKLAAYKQSLIYEAVTGKMEI